MFFSSIYHRSLIGVASVALAGTGAAASDAAGVPDDLSGYHFVSARVVKDKESPLFGFHHFYVNEKGLEPLAKGGPYPVGTRFVGLVYDVVFDGPNLDEGEGAAVALMEKVSGKEETGGWRFAQFDKKGRPMDIDETEDCFACHTQVRNRDYVFSELLGLGAFSFGG